MITLEEFIANPEHMSCFDIDTGHCTSCHEDLEGGYYSEMCTAYMKDGREAHVCCAILLRLKEKDVAQ